MPSTIELGLGRISRLLQDTTLTWKPIHVAGTNGKGSICASISAALHAAGIRVGTFTSPHLLDRWDCISIAGQSIKESLFLDLEAKVKARDKGQKIDATNFELLTATAFEAFNQEKVDVGVIEVGLGGRLDATNILKNPLVTILAKIGMDHQSFLGSTLKEIAYQKAGIMKPGVTCVYDGTNDAEAINVFKEYAKEIKAGPLKGVSLPDPSKVTELPLHNTSHMDNIPPHQRVNVSCSLEALRVVFPQLGIHETPESFLPLMTKTRLPGRLQQMSIEPLTGFRGKVLLDGAHNPQSATVLANYVNESMRENNSGITWVLAATQGKDVRSIFPIILKEKDNVVAVEFGPVAGMPWIKPIAGKILVDEAMTICINGELRNGKKNVLDGLQMASDIAQDGPVVIAGSLYLVSDVLKLVRDSN
ncbi:MAG: folylpolyglutamate synthase [Cirrosporium novae-zelandiae]|nr:MAG: folylpolyglutamate synthase [Cirrosporium novae-zelandiae]